MESNSGGEILAGRGITKSEGIVQSVMLNVNKILREITLFR
jgi:hypothetical protein